MGTFRKYDQRGNEIGAAVTFGGTATGEGIEFAGHSSQFYISTNASGTARKLLSLVWLDFRNAASASLLALITSTSATLQHKDVTLDDMYVYHQSNLTTIPTNYRLRRYDKKGNFVGAIRSGTGTQLNGIAARKDGSGFYVGSGNNLLLLDYKGNIRKSVAIGFSPSSICDDGHGLWIANATTTLRKLSYAGNIMKSMTLANTARCVCTDGLFLYTGS